MNMIINHFVNSHAWQDLQVITPVISPLWASDTIWWPRSGSKLVLVKACCRLAPSHYLNHCWLIISELLRHSSEHDDVIKWKHFPYYWPFVLGIHRSPVNSPHKGKWCGALMFSLICAGINGSVNNREAGDFRRHRANYDVTVMGQHDWKYSKSF